MTTDAPIELDAEYRQLREEAGFVRRTSLRVLEVTGADAVDFLQGQLTNDVEALEPGDASYSALLDRKGHLQSDLTLLRVDGERCLLVADEPGAEPLAKHLRTYKIGREVEVDPLDVAVVSVIGPASARASGLEGVRAVESNAGVDLFVPSGDVDRVAADLAAAGVPEVSEAAAEIVRVEAGRPRFGLDMGPETMPAEAGIVDEAVSFTKGCYIGQETVARLHYKGKPNRHLRGLRLESEARPGDTVALGDREVGRIGTAVVSPALGPIALAILRREAEPGSLASVGEAEVSAEVIALPFVSGDAA